MSKCSVGENTILTEIEDTSATESSNDTALNSRSSSYKSVLWFDLVVSMDNNV